jgi:hypothetical protein
MYVCMSICISICLSVYLSVCLSVCLSIYLSIYLSICLSVCLCMYVCICMYLSVCLCMYVCIYVCIYLLLFVGPWPLFSFLLFYTVGSTPRTGDQPVARPLPAHRTAQTQNKRTLVKLEPTIPVFQRAKTILALDREATVFGEWRNSSTVFVIGTRWNIPNRI